MTELGVAWAIVYVFLGAVILGAAVGAIWAVMTMWQSGDRLWAMLAIVLPLVVTWAVMTVKGGLP